MGSEMQICDVCRLLDHDESLKECAYCRLCRAWICKEDKPNMLRRAMAMKARMMGTVRRPCNCGKVKNV